MNNEKTLYPVKNYKDTVFRKLFSDKKKLLSLYNAEIVEQCKELKEYMLYVDRVRKYLQDMDLETAVAQAVDECIKEDILAEFLRESKAEVISMSILECDFEDIKEAVFEDAWECGMEEGLAEGGIKTLILDNLEEGKSEEQILCKLEKRFGLAKEVAREYIEKYSVIAG